MYRKDIVGNDLQFIISQAIEKMKDESGTGFDVDHINLAELGRITDISRSRLRTLKKHNFIVQPHGNTGRKKAHTVLGGYTGVLDNLLRNNVTNSVVCLERLQEQGFTGSLSTVKDYINKHKDLVPPKRMTVDPQGNRSGILNTLLS